MELKASTHMRENTTSDGIEVAFGKEDPDNPQDGWSARKRWTGEKIILSRFTEMRRHQMGRPDVGSHGCQTTAPSMRAPPPSYVYHQVTTGTDTKFQCTVLSLALFVTFLSTYNSSANGSVGKQVEKEFGVKSSVFQVSSFAYQLMCMSV